jgi:hypothetical protein
MPRGVKKENLPFKVCVICNRPFNWRKKWENCWDEVSTCSNSCNRQRRALKQQGNNHDFDDNSCDDDNIESLHEGLNNLSITENQGINTENKQKDIDNSSTDKPSTDTHTMIEDNITLSKSQMKKQRKKEKDVVNRTDDSNEDSKLCNTCNKTVDFLVRCRNNASREWKMVCNKCLDIHSKDSEDSDDGTKKRKTKRNANNKVPF